MLINFFPKIVPFMR